MRKKVYISPNTQSEIVPLLGESMLLYDEVYLDITIPSFFDVISKNIGGNSLEYLLENGILRFTNDSSHYVIGSQQNSPEEKFIFSLTDDEEKTHKKKKKQSIKKTLKPFYSKGLIDKVLNNIEETGVDHGKVLEASVYDLDNIPYVKEVLNFVVDYFELPNFEFARGDNGGVIFDPKRQLKEDERKNVTELATFGLHIIAETNQKLFLSRVLGEVSCERELEPFLKRKLGTVFENHKVKDLSDNFLELCEINNFPNIKEAVASNMLSIEDLIKLRESKNGKVLRVWLDSTTDRCVTKKVNFTKEVAKQMSMSNNIDLPTKTLTFLAIQSVGILNAPMGIVASAGTEFVLPYLQNYWRPNLFFDKARKIVPKTQNA
ncbi:hypothetical protein ACFFGV_10020 [Pontibacillus salicampi]|uniref:Uncharacterized protein n=1 Tax=Pontibacillus salicampi TaxID=1449801 RepID=A0ABV6LNM1_9BACI